MGKASVHGMIRVNGRFRQDLVPEVHSGSEEAGEDERTSWRGGRRRLPVTVDVENGGVDGGVVDGGVDGGGVNLFPLRAGSKCEERSLAVDPMKKRMMMMSEKEFMSLSSYVPQVRGGEREKVARDEKCGKCGKNCPLHPEQ